MYCTKCGNQVADSANFCTKCGAKTWDGGTAVPEGAEQVTAAPQAPPEPVAPPEQPMAAPPAQPPAQPSAVAPAPSVPRKRSRVGQVIASVALVVIVLGGGGALAAWRLGAFGGSFAKSKPAKVSSADPATLGFDTDPATDQLERSFPTTEGGAW